MKFLRTTALSVACWFGAASVGAAPVGAAPVGAAPVGKSGAPPPTYEQILPRGRIASVDAPRWVDADAAHLADDAIVFGVVIEGEARAFSLNLLNAHEVVNDTIGATPYAAVW